MIKLAYTKPELRDALLPLIREARAPGVPDVSMRPPVGVAAAVHSGRLDPKALLAWKLVVEKLGDHFSYGAGVSYWRNKCAKLDIDLDEGFLTGMGGKGVSKGFPIKGGDAIEEWVRARLRSEGLIVAVGRSATEADMVCSSLQDKIEEAKEKIAKHTKGLAKAKSPAGVKQKEKWIGKAEKDLDDLLKEIEEVKGSVAEVAEAAARHETHKAPSIAFEQRFQALLKEALRDLSQQDITQKVLMQLAQFNAQVLEAPMAVAGSDKIAGRLSAMWNRIVGALASFKAWARDLLGVSKDMNKLLDQAKAA
jgi:hypothetical protein